MTQLPNPFLSDLSELRDISQSDGISAPLVEPASCIAVPPAGAGSHQVSVSDDVLAISLLSHGESGPSVMPVYASSESLSPGVLAGSLVKIEVDPSVTLDCASGENSLGVVVDRGTIQRLEIGSRNAEYFSGPTASGAVWHGTNGCSDPATPCDLTRPSQFIIESLPVLAAEPATSDACDRGSVVGRTDGSIPSTGASSCGSTESRSAVDPDAERMRQGLDGADGCIDPMHVVPRTIAGLASGPQETFSPDDTCHIGEIFAYARRLAREERAASQPVDRIPDPQMLWPAMEVALIRENERWLLDNEPLPIFLRRNYA